MQQSQQQIRMLGNERTEELNNRISQRNIPSNPLQSQFDARPVSTKYAMMPIVDRRTIPTVPIIVREPYNVATTFNPGTAQAPWNGFASNINEESKLRNQFFALQRGANQAVYIPPSNSDMYEANVPVTNHVEIPFPYLIPNNTFDLFNPCPLNNGINLFDNCTRHQIREIK